MRVLSRSPLRSSSLARSRQACRDSVWVHLVLSGRYGNLDHPLLPSRHPPSSSLCYPGPLKLSRPVSTLLTFSFSVSSSSSPGFPCRFPCPPPRPSAELTHSLSLSLSSARARAFSPLFLADSFRASLFFFPPVHGCIGALRSSSVLACCRGCCRRSARHQ